MKNKEMMFSEGSSLIEKKREKEKENERKRERDREKGRKISREQRRLEK